MSALKIGLLFCVLVGFVRGDEVGLKDGPVRVFLLSGQSNMTGRGNLGRLDRPAEGQKATLWRYVNLPENRDRLSDLWEGEKWSVRNDVFITMGQWPHPKKGEEGYEVYRKHGGLGPFYGGRGNRGFGPELAIGHVLGDFYGAPVVLVKVAFGGNSLGGNFRPPSSGGKLGDKYPLVVKGLKEALEKIPEITGLAGKGRKVEFVGMFWNQGLSDAVPGLADEYEQNMVNLIGDLRKEFEVPDLKVVMGLTGNWGRKPEEALKRWGNGEEDRVKFVKNLRKVQEAQLRVGQRKEFEGKVVVAETRDFWRPREEFGGHGTETHWMANGESYWLIGEAMGKEMLKLLKKN